MNLINFILLLVLLVISIRADEEEKDPWDKSTDKYWKNGSNNEGQTQTKVDVTEETDSEVHTVKSKVAKEESKSGKVDKETVDQFKEALDEKDPVDEGPVKSTKMHRNKKKHLAKKSYFNHHGNFYPGSLWEYPYPYYHPQYAAVLSAVMSPCACKQGEDETFDDKIQLESDSKPLVIKPKKKKSKKAKSETSKPAKKSERYTIYYYYTPGWGGIPTYPPPTGTNTIYIPWSPYKKKSNIYATRQLVPSHYYGPPSAGWGGFQPGYSGGGWGVPYWYKKRHYTHHASRQLVPSHYYGPPSAGWGGFQPGYTGGGWGVPYWYKKSHQAHHASRQLVPSHYYGPPSAGWGGFQPGYTGGGWGAPYWYKSNVQKPEKPKSKKRNKQSKHVRASRKFVVANGFRPLLNENWNHGYDDEVHPISYNGRFQNVVPVPYDGRFQNVIPVETPNYLTMKGTDQISDVNLFNNPHLLPQLNVYSDEMRNQLAYQPQRLPSGSLNGLLHKPNSILNLEKKYPNELVLNNFAQNPLFSNNAPDYLTNHPTNSLEYSAWHGPNSLGGSGWVGNGWIGNLVGLTPVQKIRPGHGVGVPITISVNPLENIQSEPTGKV